MRFALAFLYGWVFFPLPEEVANTTLKSTEMLNPIQPELVFYFGLFNFNFFISPRILILFFSVPSNHFNKFHTKNIPNY